MSWISNITGRRSRISDFIYLYVQQHHGIVRTDVNYPISISNKQFFETNMEITTSMPYQWCIDCNFEYMGFTSLQQFQLSTRLYYFTF